MYFRWLFLIHPTFSAAKRPPIFFLLHPSEENGQRYSRKIEERSGVSDRWPVDRKGWLFVWKTKGREKADLSHGKARFKKEMLDFLFQRMDMDGYSWRRKRFFWQRLGENRFGILKKGKTCNLNFRSEENEDGITGTAILTSSSIVRKEKSSRLL